MIMIVWQTKLLISINTIPTYTWQVCHTPFFFFLVTTSLSHAYMALLLLLFLLLLLRLSFQITRIANFSICVCWINNLFFWTIFFNIIIQVSVFSFILKTIEHFEDVILCQTKLLQTRWLSNERLDHLPSISLRFFPLRMSSFRCFHLISLNLLVNPKWTTCRLHFHLEFYGYLTRIVLMVSRQGFVSFFLCHY